ncbi:MAG TPA: hypothetical protein VN278_00865 [Methanosarcina sp.]|nr:hypothetical protein [Methanosarcina sp.]
MAASLSISNLYGAVEKTKKMIRFSIFRDEKAVLEPQTELLSVALAVIGFTVFAALLSQTYLGFEDRSFALENYESASLLAETISDASVLKAENFNMLSAVALDNLSAPQGNRDREKFFAAFSGNYLFLVKVRTGDGRWQWQIVPDNAEPDSFAENRGKIAASVPVVIELNPAESVSGTLTVVLYKTAWK